MVRTLGDLNNNPRGPNNQAGNPLAMGRMGRDFDWKTIPTCFYVMSLITTVIFLLTMLTGIGFYLVNVPIATVFKLQVWRVFFCYLCTLDIFGLIIGFLVTFSLSMTEETALGSGRYFMQIFNRNLAVQILTTFFGVLIALIGMPSMSYGIWPVYFVYLTLKCLENPEGVTYFCMMPCPIKNKFYPIFLLVLFTLLGSMRGLPIDIWLGFGLAHAMSRSAWLTQMLEPSDKWSQTAQEFLMKFDGKLGQCVPLSAQEAKERANNQAPGPGNNSGPARSTPDIVRGAFSGGGTRIGGSTGTNSIFQNYDHLDKQNQDTEAATNNPFDEENGQAGTDKKNRDDLDESV